MCGPALAFVASGSLRRGLPVGKHGCDLRERAQLLREGQIVAIKGLGGFHLACDAHNEAAVRALRERKRRSDKPFALMARDLAAVETLLRRRDEDARLRWLSPRRPIVILPRRAGCAISAGRRARQPHARRDAALHAAAPSAVQRFAGRASQFRALVMTSGNLSEEPIVTVERGGAGAAAAAWPTGSCCTIATSTCARTIRWCASSKAASACCGARAASSRNPSTWACELPEMLACGGELKNTFCLTKGRYAILSQHIGDLENYETLVFFEETLANLKKLFRVEPRAVAYDLHPQLSEHAVRAERLTLEPKIGVQHHHAHIASCMAENHLAGKVIGVAFDGTGYGTDGKIWGGEFLVAISPASSGARTCATCRCPAATRRSASPGAWR